MELGMFDNRASTFGETITALELSPEGSSYRMKTRFANFFNLPELMSIFQEVADIQTADMLKLPVPEAEYENIVLPASEEQKEILQSLAERASTEKIRYNLSVRFCFCSYLNLTPRAGLCEARLLFFFAKKTAA